MEPDEETHLKETLKEFERATRTALIAGSNHLTNHEVHTTAGGVSNTLQRLLQTTKVMFWNVSVQYHK